MAGPSGNPSGICDAHRKIARSVSTFAGAGVHHIAFSTDNIFEAVARLRANGTSILRIPPNYYDDLEARFEMDPKLILR